MRFPPLIRGCSYIGLPHVLGLKPCGAGGFAASLSRRRGTPKTTAARKRQERHHCGNSFGPYGTKTNYFHRLTSFRMNVEFSIWAHLAPDLLSSWPFLARFLITNQFLVGAPNLLFSITCLLITVPPTHTDVLIPLLNSSRHLHIIRIKISSLNKNIFSEN